MGLDIYAYEQNKNTMVYEFAPREHFRGRMIHHTDIPMFRFTMPLRHVFIKFADVNINRPPLWEGKDLQCAIKHLSSASAHQCAQSLDIDYYHEVISFLIECDQREYAVGIG